MGWEMMANGQKERGVTTALLGLSDRIGPGWDRECAEVTALVPLRCQWVLQGDAGPCFAL